MVSRNISLARARYLVNRREWRRQYTLLHGLPDHVAHGLGAYMNWGCRCPECRKAQAERMRNYRKTQSDKTAT